MSNSLRVVSFHSWGFCGPMSSMRSQKIPQTLVSCSEHVDMTSVWGLWKSFGTYGVKVKDLMSIYLYMYTYICVSIYIYISVSTSISIICLDVNIYIYISLSLSTFWYTNRCQNLHMCIKIWCENMFSRGAPSCPFLALKKEFGAPKHCPQNHCLMNLVTTPSPH